MQPWKEWVRSKGDEFAKNNTLSKDEGIPFRDAVLMGNFAKMGQDDIGQTSRKIQAGTATEGNPIVAPIVNNVSPDTFRALGLVGAGALGHRWANMKDDGQRTKEEMLANIIEAIALRSSGEPFTLRYGVDF